MEKDIRTLLENTTRAARWLLEEEFARQLEGTFDIFPDGRINATPSSTLTAEQRFIRGKIVASIERRRAKGESAAESVAATMRESAFTFLNRFAAFKMMEARGLVQECVSRGQESTGFKEFTGLAPGLAVLPDKGYRLYLECLCDEIGREVGVLFNRHDSASLLWPARRALEDVLAKLNEPGLSGVWRADETIGWTYQYYNDPVERRKMRDESAAPRNSRELAVRNQFFTPRYVVEFLTDNTLGRIWYEMTRGESVLRDRCRYLVRRPNEVFLGNLSVISHLDEAAPWVRALILAGNFQELPEDPTLAELSDLGLAIDGYAEIARVGRTWDDFVATHYTPLVESGVLPGGRPLELWCVLFAYQRDVLRHGHYSDSDRASGNAVLRVLWPALRKMLLDSPAGAGADGVDAHRPIFVPYRPLKDPRTIRLLDPACGSMHFGLYAFDLFRVIYEEAWDLEEKLGASALSRPTDLVPLRTVYTTKADFLKDVPRLIIERNIHGVDIDPRAAQIAGLALWLRAQKEWQTLGLAAGQRPQVKRSNIVCAEPMPGDAEQLKTFCDSLRQPAIGQMVATLFERMKLAGEAGSLLQIEEHITDFVHTAKLRWAETYRFEKKQEELFSKADIVAVSRPKAAPQPELPIDFSGITDATFWERAEETIYAALSAYAHQAEAGATFSRQLFADDAARGFAFIDVCRQRYDVAVMNPPFGEWSAQFKAQSKKAYPNSYNDILAAFVERGGDLLHPGGRLGAITSRTCFFLSSFTKWRDHIVLGLLQPELLVDLGHGVMDAAMVEAAAYVLAKPVQIDGKSVCNAENIG